VKEREKNVGARGSTEGGREGGRVFESSKMEPIATLFIFIFIFIFLILRRRRRNDGVVFRCVRLLFKIKMINIK
jgi:hypothetical protein